MNIISFRWSTQVEYCSLMGKHPWALKHTFGLGGCVHWYRNSYNVPVKCSVLVPTQKWVLVWDTTLVIIIIL